MMLLLGIALFIVVLIIIASMAWIIHYLLIALPRQQRDILDHFSPGIVNQLLLEYAALPQALQKQIAIEKIGNVFVEFGIPSPGDTIVEAAIGDAMYTRKIQEADLWIKELKADQLSQTNTSEMPIIPKEELWIL